MPPQEINSSPQVIAPATNIPVAPLQNPPKKHPVRKAIKYFFITLALIIIIILGLVISLSVFAKDTPPVDDQDLQPKFNIPARQDNMYYDLNEVKESAKETNEVMGYLENKNWDEAAIKQLISENAETFNKLDQAAKKTSFHDPYYADSETPIGAKEEEPPHLAAYQKLARLNTLRAMNLINEGKTEEGVNVILATLSIGDAFEKSGDSMITYLVGSAIKHIALSGLQQSIPKMTYTQEQFNQLNGKLMGYSAKPEGLANGFKHEYKNQTYAINQMATGQGNNYTGSHPAEIVLSVVSKSKFYHQPNKSKQLYVDLYRAHLKELANPCSQIKSIGVERQPANIFFQENGLGLLLFNIGAVSFSGTINTKCIVDFNLNATRVLLALRAYQLDNKSLPNSLQELTPAYISQLPIDPYDDQPLKYSKSKKVIYSVGQDKNNNESIADTDNTETQNYRKLINF